MLIFVCVKIFWEIIKKINLINLEFGWNVFLNRLKKNKIYKCYKILIM